jgi:hypothetical protein
VLDHFLALAPEPRQRVLIEGADHFFQGVPGSPKPKLDVMQAALRDWLSSTFDLREPIG